MLLTWGGAALQWGSGNNLYWGLEAEPEEDAGGHSGGHGYWYYRRLVERRRKRREDDEKERQLQVAIRYASRLAKALEQADAEDAKRLAESAARLDALIRESEFRAAYLVEAAAQMVQAARAAAAENQSRIESQMRAAAEYARLLEDDLRDEEEAEFLLLMG